jgi:hypothetical protein
MKVITSQIYDFNFGKWYKIIGWYSTIFAMWLKKASLRKYKIKFTHSQRKGTVLPKKLMFKTNQLTIGSSTLVLSH